MNNIDCGIKKQKNMPYIWDSQIWEDFISIIEFLIWAFIKKEEMEKNDEYTLDFSILVEKEIEEAESIIKRRMELSNISGINLHTYKFFSVYNLSSIEKFAFIVSAASEINYKLNSILIAAERNKNVKSPTVEMILKLYNMINIYDLKETADLINVKDDFELCIEKDNINKPLSHRSFIIKNTLLSYLLGQSFDIHYKGFDVKYPIPDILIYDDVLKKAVNIANSQTYLEKPVTLYIYGKKKSGKKLLVSHLSQQIGKEAFFIMWNDIIKMSDEKKESFFNDISLKMKLEKGFICLYGIPNFSDEKEEFYNYIFSKIINICEFTVVLGESKYDFPVWLTENFISLELWELSVTEKISVWSHYNNIYNTDKEIDVNLNGNKYIMSVGEIENTFKTAYYCAASQNEFNIKDNHISDAIKQRERGKLCSYASLIEGAFVWDDLIIDASVKQQMRYICNQIKYRNIVGEEWGFFEKTSYGRGVSALFYGPPGTGKTMAVQIIAKELGLELYRVDLSKMVSKYIGETEKNISALFDIAKNMNVILFFDEADSLFAKRSEVKDSNDRNANAETAHLLQKMEEYEGMVILATNLVEQIDDAFRRRIKFMVPFRFPDVSTRIKLWHSLIPEKTPLDDSIDLDFFANQFELSGSQIKEILWNAAYIAVSDNQPLGNEQIKQSIIWNYIKYGKQLIKEDFGYLA